jgi:hypothetical protein
MAGFEMSTEGDQPERVLAGVDGIVHRLECCIRIEPGEKGAIEREKRFLHVACRYLDVGREQASKGRSTAVGLQHLDAIEHRSGDRSHVLPCLPAFMISNYVQGGTPYIGRADWAQLIR